MLLWFSNRLRANESPAAGSVLFSMCTHTVFVCPGTRGIHTHICPSVRVCVHSFPHIFSRPVRFSRPSSGSFSPFPPAQIKRAPCVSSRDGLPCLLPGAVKSSRCCFFLGGVGYLLNPLVSWWWWWWWMVGGTTRSSLMAWLPTIKARPVFISDIYLISRIVCRFFFFSFLTEMLSPLSLWSPEAFQQK